MDWWRLAHILSLIWLGAGMGSTYPQILRAWTSKDVRYQAYCLVEAANSETRLLLPGAMATGITGFFWAVAGDWNFVKDGWLGALALLFVFLYFVCLPLMGFGLRRTRLAVLAAEKKGRETEELRGLLDDRVPVVFGTILVIGLPVMAWLAVFQPF